MNFLKHILEIITSLGGEFSRIVLLFVNFLKQVEVAYPGLIDIMTPLIEAAKTVIDAVIQSGGSDEEVEKMQSIQRESIVAETKLITSGSKRAVSESVIRSTLEGIVASMKYAEDQIDEYDEQAVRDHAVDILSKYGAGGGR